MLAVLLLVGAVAGGVYAVYFSTLLDVEGVEVQGAEGLVGEEVRTAAEVPDGEPLATVDLRAVEARVESLAPVLSADVSRKWPDQVLVRVEERVPVAVVRIGGVLRGMDRSGVLFEEYRSAPPGLPQVEASAGVDTEALRESAAVVATLPREVTEQVAQVEVATVDLIRLRLRDGRLVVWGSAAESELKAQVLPALLTRPAQVYDVTVPARPTTSDTPPLG